MFTQNNLVEQEHSLNIFTGAVKSRKIHYRFNPASKPLSSSHDTF